MGSTTILEGSHDLTAATDPEGYSGNSAGHIDRSEESFIVEEAMMCSLAIDVEPDDLAAIVDPAGEGSRSTRERHIDRGEGIGGLGYRESTEENGPCQEKSKEAIGLHGEFSFLSRGCGGILFPAGSLFAASFSSVSCRSM
jgi:hypothetical protein